MGGASAWAALGVSVLAYELIGLAMHQPFHEGHRALRYFDLQIYRGAAARIRQGIALYGAPIHGGLGFTYPPFAALLMLPLAYVSLTGDEIAVTVINLMLLVWVMHRAQRLASRRTDDPIAVSRRRARRWSLAALLAAAALWLEPVSVTVGYGQIDLLIAALVIGDLSRPDRARTKGVGVGLAAALKLTPLLFIGYLLLSGRRRAAALATAVFAGSIAIAYAALGGDATLYWSRRRFLDPSRIGTAAATINQSLRGAIARVGAQTPPGLGAELAIGCIAAGGLALAVHYSRRGDEAAGFSLTALTTLLASPVSWTHHWTLAVPALFLLGRRAHERHSRRLYAATAALLTLGYAYAPEHAASQSRGLVTLLTDDPYVIVALIALAATASTVIKRREAQVRALPVRAT